MRGFPLAANKSVFFSLFFNFSICILSIRRRNFPEESTLVLVVGDCTNSYFYDIFGDSPTCVKRTVQNPRATLKDAMLMCEGFIGSPNFWFPGILLSELL